MLKGIFGDEGEKMAAEGSKFAKWASVNKRAKAVRDP
jgi:hypothetical protein